MNSELATELEKLVNKNIDLAAFPYVKGKSIRIKHIIIREARFGFLVFDTKENKEIAKMFCKTSAVALARTIALGRSGISDIKNLDCELAKHYNDALFHRYTMRITKDPARYDVAECRYEIAFEKTQVLKERLDSYIYN